MFVRISDRGEPAKINFCRLRTDSVENSPDSPFAGARASAVDCTDLSINRSSCAPSSGQVTHYFRLGQTKLPEFTEPVWEVVETPNWFSSVRVEERSRSKHIPGRASSTLLSSREF